MSTLDRVHGMIGVVLPVRNGSRVLATQLEALAAQRCAGPWRVYVADNGSTDSTAEVAESFTGRLPLVVVRVGPIPGVNRARNVGARAAIADGADVILFCDADDAVGVGWLPAMASAADEWDAWGGALDRTRLSNAARLRESHRVSTGLMPWPGYLRFASGASLGVRADVFERLGGFDEEFVGGGGDDVDFSWRIQQAGYSLGYVPGAVVHYRERSNLSAIARQFRSYGAHDALLYRKHRANGMPPSSARAAARAWAHLLVRAPRYLRTEEQRGQWVRMAARRWGRIEGSIRYRTLYL